MTDLALVGKKRGKEKDSPTERVRDGVKYKITKLSQSVGQLGEEKTCLLVRPL